MFQSKQHKGCSPQGCCRPWWTWAWAHWMKCTVSPVACGACFSGWGNRQEDFCAEEESSEIRIWGLEHGFEEGSLRFIIIDCFPIWSFIIITVCFPLWSFIQDLDFRLSKVPGYLAMRHLPPVLLSGNSWKCRRLPSCELFCWFT